MSNKIKVINNRLKINLFQSQFALLDSNMYIFKEKNDLLVVDPHYSIEMEKLLDTFEIDSVTILLTHEHPDHTQGVPYFVNKYKAIIICQEDCAESIKDEKNNRPTLINFILAQKDKIENTDMLSKVPDFFQPYKCEANKTFKEHLELNWNSLQLKFFHTPGHSKGSSCILINEELVLTGDSFLENLPIITRFKGGSLDEYKKITLPFLNTLKEGITILPGHGKVFKHSKDIIQALKFN